MNNKSLVGFLGVLLALSPLCAQDQGNASVKPGMSNEGVSGGSTFSSRSQLVLVPALVTDGSGKHVSGLKREDFIIKEDGRLKTVKLVEEMNAKPAAPKRTVLASGTYSNTAADQAPMRIVIILFDMLNSHFKDQVPARRQVVKYLAEDVDPGTLVCVMGLGRGGLRMYHDLTTDTKGLAAALAGASAQGRHALHKLDIPGSDGEDDVSTSAQSFVGHGEFQETGSSGRKSRKFIIINTLEAFRNIAGAYAGVPGRKSLIWVTTGFPFSLDGYKTGSMPALDQDSLVDMLPDYERTWQMLNDANVALYPVDMHGLLNTSAPDATYAMHKGGNPTQQLGTFARDRQDKNSDNIGTLKTFASMTGGKAFYNNNDLVRGFREATTDSESSYLLGYYLQKDTKPGWHKLQVEVSRPGVHVRARSGYFIAPRASGDTQKDSKDVDVQLAMSSPVNFTGVPVTVKWLGVLADKSKSESANQKSRKKTVGFQISLPPHTATVDAADSNRLALNFVGLARTQDAEDAADFVKKVDVKLKPEVAYRIREAGFKLDSTMELAPGRYNVRFVVRDNLSGRVGSVTAPLTVR